LGLLDAQGKLVMDTICQEIRCFADKFYIIAKEGESGVFDQFLGPVIPFARQIIEQTNNAFHGQDKYLFVLNRDRPEQNFMVLDSIGNIVFKGNGTSFHVQQECKCFILRMYNGEQLVYSTQSGIQLAFRDSFEQVHCLGTGK